MLKYLKVCNLAEKKQATIFSKTFDVKLEKLPNMAGTSGDFIVVYSKNEDCPVNTVVEFKNDSAAKRTGNVFLEIEQTSDNWFTTKCSGVALAVKKGQLVVITCGEENFLLKTIAQFDELVSMKHTTRTTKSGRNGNPNGCFTKGHLVKLGHVRNILEWYRS